jgi:rSAM/selenodomain-associated transferase 2
VIVVDGGSDDDTVELARPGADLVLSSPPGRALQMNAGAYAASGGTLVFLHADTRLPANADDAILSSRSSWGRFDVTIEGRHPMLRVIGALMNLRSRLTGIATGDQAIFVRRDAFEGFSEIALMEDIAFSRAMKHRSAPACLRERVVTSGRRWEAKGVWRTVFLMWRLRWRYWRGESPEELARLYGR